MEYIIPSIGRCGSNLLTSLISKASGKKACYVNSYDKLGKHDGHVKKTHLHFKKELNCDYRAIYLHGDMGDIIASIYNLYGNPNFQNKWQKEIRNIQETKEKLNPLFWKGFLGNHLKHLEVKKRHIIMFFIISRLSKQLAFLYLIIGDKFRFKENIESWRGSRNVLFVKYEELCKNKKESLRNISNFLGLTLPDFKVKKRKSSKLQLPLKLQRAIKSVYSNLAKI